MSDLTDQAMTTAAKDTTDTKNNWQLNALTEALGDLSLTVTDSLSVGRGSDNDVVLGSKQVSRNHALLSVLNGELYVKDLDSSNGTFINDGRIDGNKSKLLKANDTIGFASFVFQVATGVAATDSEQPIVTDAEVEDIETVATEVVNTEVADAVVIDNAIMNDDSIDTEIVDAEIIEAEVIEPDFTKTEVIEAEIITESSSNEAVDSVDEFVEEIVVEETVIHPTSTDIGIVDHQHDSLFTDPTVKTSTVEDRVIEAAVIEEAVVEEAVIKETIIKDVLSSIAPTDLGHATDALQESGATTAPVAHELEATAALSGTPVINDVIGKEPDFYKEPTLQPQLKTEPLVTPKHDKTTKTALQREADPDILRAKQAATGQLSGTTNLEQHRDVGTQGNNAIDQAINNPATTEVLEKKPSGGWFIWVFIAIIIIGLALWLFNMGAA